MTKVEELRENIVAMAIEPTARKEVTSKLDSLIAAAKEEGAEQERERIREGAAYMAEGTIADCDALYVRKEYALGMDYHVVMVYTSFYMVDPSVLDDPKEPK